MRAIANATIVLALAAAPGAQQRPQSRPTHITTPKEAFGVDIGDDYQLANYRQIEGVRLVRFGHAAAQRLGVRQQYLKGGVLAIDAPVGTGHLVLLPVGSRRILNP
jgi:hypothetical protein